MSSSLSVSTWLIVAWIKCVSSNGGGGGGGGMSSSESAKSLATGDDGAMQSSVDRDAMDNSAEGSANELSGSGIGNAVSCSAAPTTMAGSVTKGFSVKSEQ